jgi:GNAT superfamily N-acetyltransferase
MRIKECIADDEIRATFFIMQQLRPNLTNADEYLRLVQTLKETEGYRLTALFDGETCVATAGFRVKRCLFSGGNPEIYIDDFITDSEKRSQGFGMQLFAWLKNECRELSCAGISLDSGTQRIEAHKFYSKEGMQKTAFHFYKPCFPSPDENCESASYGINQLS